MTGEDLGYKPDPVQKTKFEYSLLGQVFNKRLDMSEKQEGLWRRLKNIEDNNEQQLDLIREQGDRQLDLVGNIDIDNTKGIEFYYESDKTIIDLVKKG